MLFVGIVLLAFWILVPAISFGLGEYTPLAPLGDGVSVSTEGNGAVYFEGVFRLALGIAGVLAVLMIVVGGVRYMLSDAFTSKEGAKNQIWAAIWGLLILFASVLILETINPGLLNLEINPPVLQQIAPTGNGSGVQQELDTSISQSFNATTPDGRAQATTYEIQCKSQGKTPSNNCGFLFTDNQNPQDCPTPTYTCN